MTHASLQAQIIFHEGKKFCLYKCEAGFLTIGVGRNLETNGVRDDEIMLMLKNDIEESTNDLVEIFGAMNFDRFSKGRKWALIDLRLNLGPGRFRAFKKMIGAIKGCDWSRAALELKDSLWWRSPKVQEVRKETLHNQLLTGEK